MKRLVIMFFILTSTFQSIAQERFALGISTGITLSDQRWEYDFSFERERWKGVRVGTNAMVFGDFNLTSHFRLQLGAGYYEKGFREKRELESPTLVGSYTLIANNHIDYAHFFANATWYPNASQRGLYLLAGFNHNVRIGRTAHDLYLEHFRFFKRWNESVTVGAGWESKGTCISWFAQFQWHRDITQAFFRNDLKIYNYAGDFRVGIKVRDFGWWYAFRDASK